MSSLLLSGSPGVLDVLTEGIVLQRMQTRTSQRTGYPKSRDDFPDMHSLPPTYEQAVSGRDRSVKVEESTNPGLTTAIPVAQPGVEGGSSRIAGSGNLPSVMSDTGSPVDVVLPEMQQASMCRLAIETELSPPPPYFSNSVPPLHHAEVDEEEQEVSDGDDQPLLPA